jgi:hypothetical protein
MRILLGYTNEGLDPDTRDQVAALDGAELVDVSADDFAYWRAIEERWTGTEDLLIIEQDMIIHDEVVPQLLACPQQWCVFPYPIFNSGQRLTQGLGCTRFGAALQRQIPAAEFERDGKLRNIIDPGLTGVPWQFLDLVIAGRLRLGHGLKPHVHTPDVEHRHDYSGPPTLGPPGFKRHPGEPPKHPDDNPLSVYHRPIPVMFDPVRQPPGIQVYGAEMSEVSCPDDAARLANALQARYMNADGSARYVPAQYDTDRPLALRFASDKVSQGYLPTYLKIAAEIGTAGRVCEVGVLRGESLHMWQALFPGGVVAGVDRSEESVWPQESVQIIASQEDDDLPGKLAAVCPAWDLIVDDASHLGKLTRITWELLWPLVRPGGWYVIEDWFVGYGNHPLHAGDHSMMRTAESFLALFTEPGGEVESVEYRYGLIIVRKAPASSRSQPAR